MFLNKKLLNVIQGGPLNNAVKALFNIAESFIILNNLKKNNGLNNLYENNRCFLLFSGVSLNEIDFSFLKNEYTFCCNLDYLHKNFSQLNVNFYAEIQHLFGFIYTDPLKVFSDIEKACPNPDTIFFLRAFNKLYIENRSLFNERKNYYVRGGKKMSSFSSKLIDLAKPIDFFDGIIHFMVAAAIYMGFKELYLCGCGYTYSPILEFHFYDEYKEIPGYAFPWEKPLFPLSIPQKERKKLIENFAASRGMEIFSSRYTESDQVVRFVRNAPVSGRYQILQELAEYNNVKIINIVPDGFISPVFSSVSFSKLFPV